jgi:hypothetical protein
MRMENKGARLLVCEDGKQRRWTGTYEGGQDPHRVVASVKKKKILGQIMGLSSHPRLYAVATGQQNILQEAGRTCRL